MVIKVSGVCRTTAPLLSGLSLCEAEFPECVLVCACSTFLCICIHVIPFN